jgi:TPP-dependent 2-oxoacid decarboxylase
MSDLNQNIGGYLIQRLYDNGVRHIFGVPGDFVLGFYKELIDSNKLKVINTCDEQGAAFAADSYARINGLGAVCVTYCVGGLKIANATAQAFAEKSPLVVISGAPGIMERKKNPLLHHKVRDFDTQQRIFEHMTVDSTLIDNPQTAAKDIDRVLSSAVRYKRPVYIELPRDKQDDLDNKGLMCGMKSDQVQNRNNNIGYHAQSNNNNAMQFSARKNRRITVKRLFERINFSMTPNVILIADVGDSLFGALDLTIPGHAHFLSPAYYLSMGFAVPAAIGAQPANPKLRPIVVVGDGAFQMTGMEISTVCRFGLNPIIIILNNNGYGTERPMLDGPFNDVLSWNYHRIPEIIGHGRGFAIETEEQLEVAFLAAENIHIREPCILDVRLDSHDGSPALQRLTESLGKKVQ